MVCTSVKRLRIVVAYKQTSGVKLVFPHQYVEDISKEPGLSFHNSLDHVSGLAGVTHMGKTDRSTYVGFTYRLHLHGRTERVLSNYLQERNHPPPA